MRNPKLQSYVSVDSTESSGSDSPGLEFVPQSSMRAPRKYLKRTYCLLMSVWCIALFGVPMYILWPRISPMLAELAYFGRHPRCLCIFDIDRTLTGYQDKVEDCPGNQVYPGVSDTAFLWAQKPPLPDHGNLTISGLGASIRNTFCSECYLGLATAACPIQEDSRNAVIMGLLTSGSKLYKMNSDPGFSTWVEMLEVIHGKKGSPLVACSLPDEATEGPVEAVQIISDWYRSKGFRFDDEEVFYFDDKLANVEQFRGSRFNARQVSCATRDDDPDDDRGFCGAEVEEVQRQSGVYVCKGDEQEAIE